MAEDEYKGEKSGETLSTRTWRAREGVCVEHVKRIDALRCTAQDNGKMGERVGSEDSYQ
jgi:hypothetical protein